MFEVIIRSTGAN